MSANVTVKYTDEEIARMEIRNFINDGLKDVQNGDLYDFDEVFEELERRYANAEV